MSVDGVIWLISGRCQLRCRHCYASRFFHLPQLGVEEKLRIARDVAEHANWVALTGGEPLIDPAFWSVVEVLRDHGVEVYVNTNGLVVSGEVARRLARLEVAGVFVSLDGSRESHEALRGPGTWEPAVRAVKLLQAEGVPVETVMALGRSTLRAVEEYPRIVAELGLGEAAVIPVMPQGEAIRSREYLENAGVVAGALLRLEEAAVEAGLSSIWVWCYPAANLITRRGVLRATYCRPSRVVDIDPMGRLLLCDVLDLAVGDVLRGFGEALKLYEEHPLVRLVEEPPQLPEACRRCPIGEWCRGGCYARSLHLLGSLNAGDPLCPLVHSKYASLGTQRRG